MSHTSNVVRLTFTLPFLLALGACVTPPPSGPSFTALPADGKTFDRFSAEDSYCRQAALSRSGYSNSSGANATLGGATVGTLVGAAGGALIGAAAGNAGIGAAAGAGAGLLAGSSIGASNGNLDAAEVQHNYDSTYAACIASYGNKVPSAGQISSYPYGYSSYGGYGGYGYGGYGGFYPGYAFGYGYPFFGPGFGFGFGGIYNVGFFGRGYYGHGFYGGGFHGGRR
jgi:hypothetical protein